MWPVQPIPPYTFEILPAHLAPRQPIVDVPAEELWPEFGAYLRRRAAAKAANGLEATLAAFGFDPPHVVRPLTSIESLFPKKQRYGIYVLHFTDDAYYVGQSKDVVNRFAQHRLRFGTIERLSFCL